MDKISAAQVAQVLETVGPTLRKIASERDYAVAKLAAYEERAEVEKVATLMIQKGVTAEPFARVCESMAKAAAAGELDVIRAALQLQGPDMGDKIAHLIDDENPYVGAAGASDLETFILTGN